MTFPTINLYFPKEEMSTQKQLKDGKYSHIISRYYLGHLTVHCQSHIVDNLQQSHVNASTVAVHTKSHLHQLSLSLLKVSSTHSSLRGSGLPQAVCIHPLFLKDSPSEVGSLQTPLAGNNSPGPSGEQPYSMQFLAWPRRCFATCTSLHHHKGDYICCMVGSLASMLQLNYCPSQFGFYVRTDLPITSLQEALAKWDLVPDYTILCNQTHFQDRASQWQAS